MEYVALVFVIIGVIVLLFAVLKPRFSYNDEVPPINYAVKELAETRQVNQNQNEDRDNNSEESAYHRIKAIEYDIESDVLRKLFSGKITKELTSKFIRTGNVEIQISPNGITCYKNSAISFIRFDEIKTAYFEKEYILLELYTKLSRVFFVNKEDRNKIDDFKEKYLAYCSITNR